MREKLQEENHRLNDKCDQLQHQHKAATIREKNLEKQLKDLKISQTSSINDKTNHDLTVELEETKKELSVLKSTHGTLEKTLEDLKNANEKEILKLQSDLSKSENELKQVYTELLQAKEQIIFSESKSKEDAENYKKLAFILDSYEKQVTSLKEELDTVRNEGGSNADVHKTLQNDLNTASCEIEELKRSHESALKDFGEKIGKLNEDYKNLKLKNDDMHRAYINILTENVKRYLNSEYVNYEPSEDPQVMEFNKHVESIFKILLDFKDKCQSLERQILETTQEKNNLLNEKNNEIEKLLQHSDVLSHEVIHKTETIKELETEITNLITSNDMLMSEIESCKSNSVLQPISESNEDSMVLLETALDNANEKIKELEKIVENESKSPEPMESTILNHEDYRELLSSYDSLKIDHDTTVKELIQTKSELADAQNDNDILKSQLDKNKADFENTEYQLSEANFTIDNLREEMEVLNVKLSQLSKQHDQMKTESMNNIDLKSDLNELKEKLITEEDLRRNAEGQIKSLTEKVQKSKMSETSLKLQYDTLSKENIFLSETKVNLENSVANLKTCLTDCENKYTNILQKYDEVLLKCEDLNTQLHQKEIEQFSLNNQLIDIKEQNEKLSKLTEDNDSLIELKAQLKLKEEEILRIVDELNDCKNMYEELQNDRKVDNDRHQSLISRHEEEIRLLRAELQKILDSNNGESQETEELRKEILSLQKQVEELTTSRNELINMITVKHQESVTYHNEIQRLLDVLQKETDKSAKMEAQLVQTSSLNENLAKKNEEIDKLTDQINFLKEKSEILTNNLIEEQSKSGPTDKEISLSKQLERLQSHLMEVEEHYTQELLQVEQKNADLQSKLADLEQREKNSSTMYTSVSIRANQQVEALQKQLQTVTNQREELMKKISDSEDANNKQAVALANLQFVLEQFQKDREKDIIKETDRIRRQINAEKQLQADLKKDIENLKTQLEDSKQGLQAASRLSDQLEITKKQNLGLKEEVSHLQQKLVKNEQTIQNLTSQTDGKIEKSLIKNLVVGLLSSGNTNWNKDQAQVLKIIATVLDFNQQDHDKVKLNKAQQASWLGSILFPQSSVQNMSNESLSQAFVKFLENESKPRIVPNLLDSAASYSGVNGEANKRVTGSVSPMVLNEIVLPTFADFGQIRNSSSILKDVLKDNTS
ncbi:uncharacterized protein LOC143197870 isoform X2 [Rhynchophorus ferrugineus]